MKPSPRDLVLGSAIALYFVAIAFLPVTKRRSSSEAPPIPDELGQREGPHELPSSAPPAMPTSTKAALPTISPECSLTLPAIVGEPHSLALSWIGTDELDPGMTPSVEGLFERTSGQWDQADFLTLTPEEARALIPIEPELDVTLPGSLISLLGGLPTREDAEAAYRYPGVREKLLIVCSDELELLALSSAPNADRGRDLVHAIETARRSFDAAEDELMAELDRVSSYKRWRLMNRLFREWSRE